jgi:hypothetical protein
LDVLLRRVLLQLDHRHDTPLGEGLPCPDCGSQAKVGRFDGPNAGRMMTGIKVVKKPGEKRSPVEEKMGDELQADGGWKRVHRIIDRRGDRYYEKVHDPDTREVTHLTDEPLSEHVGHGAAKPRKG